MKHVADLMTTMPIQVTATTPVGEVAKLMREQDVGTVLVTGGSRVIGVVTDRDLVLRVLADDRGPTMMVGAACTSDPVTLSPRDDVGVAVDLMRTHRVRRIPVVEEGRAVGILSLGDLAEAGDDGSLLRDISSAEPNN